MGAAYSGLIRVGNHQQCAFVVPKLHCELRTKDYESSILATEPNRVGGGMLLLTIHRTSTPLFTTHCQGQEPLAQNNRFWSGFKCFVVDWLILLQGSSVWSLCLRYLSNEGFGPLPYANCGSHGMELALSSVHGRYHLNGCSNVYVLNVIFNDVSQR